MINGFVTFQKRGDIFYYSGQNKEKCHICHHYFIRYIGNTNATVLNYFT